MCIISLSRYLLFGVVMKIRKGPGVYIILRLFDLAYICYIIFDGGRVLPPLGKQQAAYTFVPLSKRSNSYSPKQEVYKVRIILQKRLQKCYTQLKNSQQ